MKKLLSIILTLVLLTSITSICSATPMFEDVPFEYELKRPIEYLAENGIVNGKTATQFCPDDFIKREEFAKLLAKSFALPENTTGKSFSDTETSAWYTPYINAVSASGLMTGISDTEFGVGMFISRQDMAVTLKRAADSFGIKYSEGYSVQYADAEEISDYAKEAVQVLSAARALREFEDGKFCPTQKATRAIAAKAIYFTLMDAKPKEHIDELAPAKIYEPSIMPKIELISEDFEDDDYGELFFTEFHDHKKPIERDDTVGFESNGSAILYESGFPCLTFKTNEVYPGEILELSYMVKGENISGDGHYRAICQVFDDEKKWLKESGNPKFEGDTDWVQASVTVMVPDIGNDLNPPEFYYVTVCPYMLNMTGTVHFDNFKVSKILFNPMETVLMTPNYKGLIRGEGGQGDISLRTYIYDMNDAYNLEDLSFTSQIVDNEGNILLKSKVKDVTKVMDVYYSSASLCMGGDYWIQSILTDKHTGEVIQKQEWGLRKREADFKTEFAIDEYNRILINGEPDLPMYVYNTGGGTANYESCAELLDNAKGHNLDSIWEMGFGGWEDDFQQDTEITRAWMKNFETGDAQGVSFVGSAGATILSKELLGPRRDGKLHFADYKPYLERKINYMKEVPQLSCYYIYDESDATKYGEEYHWVNEVFASLDLDHPTICAVCDLQPNRPGVYSKTSDFLGTDPYPVEGKETDDLSKVYKDLIKIKELNPNRPYYLIPQMFRWERRGDLRPPTKEEFRNMLFQGLCAGTCMFNSYGYRDLQVTCPDTWEQDFENYMSIYDEIGELEKIYLSVLPAPYYEVKDGGEWFNHTARRYDGKSYLFAVNNQKQKNTAKVYLDGVKEIKGLYSGKTLKSDSNGWFNIPFEALQTEVFVYDQAEYKSSHAELIRFGLIEKDGNTLIITDADSEKPCFIVKSNITDVNYMIKASDFAKLYINGNQVENKGTISLNGLDKITIKIVSEDERFQTEKTYLLKRID